MRGTVAKRLRREAYGDMAKQTTYGVKSKQKYTTRTERRLDDKTGRKKDVVVGYMVNRDTVVCTGLRGEYLKRKREYVQSRRER